MLKTSLKVLKKLEENGYSAYIVGGFVRDYILGIDSLDVDIATNATPKEMIQIFESSVLPKEEYGAVTLFIKNHRFEITTFRKEIQYIHNRKPVEIEYIDDLLEDLKRRDFKMNTLCMDKDGNIIDLLNGREDIDHKIINTVGSSDQKFKEDSLRMLRAIRFATVLNFGLSEEVRKAILDNKSELRGLSYHRKKQELDKIFSSTNSKYGINLLLELGLDKELELNHLNEIKDNYDIIGVWTSLEVGEKYPFTSNEKEIMEKVRKVLKTSINNLSLYRYGLYINQVASDILGIDRSEVSKRYEELPITSRKEIEITSQEIMQILNRKEGAYFRELYCDLEEKILNRELENEKEHIKKYLLDHYS